MNEQAELFYMAPEPQEARQEPSRPKWAGNLSKQARDVVRAMLPAMCWRGCGTQLEPDGDNWTAGHITDRADGGGNEPSNLAPECKRCNYSHGGKRGAAVTNARKLEPVNLARVRRVSWW